MNILVVGSGAREHAIAWKLTGSRQVDRLFLVPGNAGTASIGVNLKGPIEDLMGLADLAMAKSVDLTIVGPEVPLARGIVDLFGERGLAIFGPTRAAARIEASKAFARGLMLRHDIPGPEFKVFHDYDNAHSFLSKHEGPVVVKADGLAAGKGALVCAGRDEALKALHDCMKARSLGSAGDVVVVEQYLEGREVSVFAFSDGEHLSPLVAACDYKRLLDGDAGPNTGGMGSYSPPELWTSDLADRVGKEIMTPVVRALKEEGAPYKGVLYAGLMVTPDGPRVLEFNCRLGDPETQTLMPRMASDPLELMLACSEGNLDRIDVRWDERHYVGVVLASGGYPDKYDIGFEVSGLDAGDADTGASLVFTAGVAAGPSGGPVTAGGRVLSVVGGGDSIAEARAKAYARLNGIAFPGAHWRTDIGLSA
jgi:phosphoribosylamine--glycine ligase